jgi:hypothetical protein
VTSARECRADWRASRRADFYQQCPTTTKRSASPRQEDASPYATGLIGPPLPPGLRPSEPSASRGAVFRGPAWRGLGSARPARSATACRRAVRPERVGSWVHRRGESPRGSRRRSWNGGLSSSTVGTVDRVRLSSAATRSRSVLRPRRRSLAAGTSPSSRARSSARSILASTWASSASRRRGSAASGLSAQTGFPDQAGSSASRRCGTSPSPRLTCTTAASRRSRK